MVTPVLEEMKSQKDQVLRWWKGYRWLVEEDKVGIDEDAGMGEVARPWWKW